MTRATLYRYTVLWAALLGVLASASEPPRLLVLPTSGVGLSAVELESFDEALRFGFAATGYFRVLTPDEVQEAARMNGRHRIGSCIWGPCFVRAARMTRAEMVVQPLLRATGTTWALSLPVRDSLGTELGTAQIETRSTSAEAFIKLGRSAPALLVGVPGNATALEITAPQRTPPLWIWLGSGAVLGGTYLWLAQRYGTWNQPGALSSDLYASATRGEGATGIAGFFASHPPHARLRGLGGAGAALVASAPASALNPAALVGLAGHQVEIASSSLPEGVPQIAALYASPLGHGVWHAQHLRFEGDALAGEFSLASVLATDLSLYSEWLRGIRAGIALKGLLVQAGSEGSGEARSRGTGMGWSTDLGLSWSLYSRAQIGLALKDIASQMRYYNELTGRSYREVLPPSLTGGLAWQEDALLLAFDLRKGLWPDQKDRLHGGIERRFFDIALVRGGWNRVLDGGLQTWNLGMGFQHTVQALQLSLDYAWEIPGESSQWWGQRHSTSLSMRW